MIARERYRLDGKGGSFVVRWSERLPGRPIRTNRANTGIAVAEPDARSRAEKFMQALRREHERIDREAVAPTVGMLLNAYERNLDARKRGSNATATALKALRSNLADVPATPEAIMAAVEEYREARKQPRKLVDNRIVSAGDATIRHELQILRSALNKTLRKETGFDPNAVEFDLPPEGAPREIWLPPKEFAAFKAAVLADSPPEGEGRLTRLTRFALLAAETAARRAKIEMLHWEHVDLEHRIIRYPPGRVGSRKRAVAVPISPELTPILERAYRERRTDYVLDHTGSIRAEWEAWREGEGAAWSITPHDLRRTWASNALLRGVPIESVADFLGDDAETVRKHYKRFLPEHLRSVFGTNGNEDLRARCEALEVENASLREASASKDQTIAALNELLSLLRSRSRE